MKDSSSYKAIEAFKPLFNVLARVAYTKMIPKSDSELKNGIHYFYRISVWILVLTYNFQHFIRVLQVYPSIDQMINILFILLTILSTLLKQLAFNIKSRRIDQIIEVINGPEFAPQNAYHEDVMRRNAKVMHQILRFYISSVVLCGSLWTIFPIVNQALGEDVFFTGYFPFDTKVSPGFEIAVAWMNILITFQALGNVTMDCIIVAFYAQIKVQLRCLRYNLEHLAEFTESQIRVKSITNINLGRNYCFIDSIGYNYRVLKEKLTQCIQHHKKILWLNNEIEDVFASALMFQLFIQAFVICLTVYKIVDLNLFSAEFLSMAMYLGCMLAELFLYCYYGSQVKYESELVNQSIYFSSWLSLSPRFCRDLIIMREKLKCPIIPRTAYIVPISLDTYIAILKASYSLFAFLDHSKH